jgi:hypothetical protein
MINPEEPTASTNPEKPAAPMINPEEPTASTNPEEPAVPIINPEDPVVSTPKNLLPPSSTLKNLLLLC